MWARTSPPFHGQAACLQVDAVGRRVLADDQQLLRPRRDQLLGLAQDRVGSAADQVAAQARDDAEGAAMIAALGNLQIGIMARGQLQPRVRHQVEIGRRRHRRGDMDRADHLLILGGAGDREHVGEALADQLGLLAHAAGDDDAAILGDRLADRGQALLLGGIEEAAGVDQDDVGAGIIGRHGIAVAPAAWSGCARNRPAPSGSRAKPCRSWAARAG